MSYDESWIPETITYPKPSYPAEAVSKKLSGNCMVMFDLSIDGTPTNMLAECTDPVFESEAAALKGAVFQPVLNDEGNPVEVKGITYPLAFCIA